MTRVGGGGAGGRVRNACARREQTSKCKLNRRVKAKGRSSASTQNSRSAMAEESVEGAEERVERIVERVLERQLPIIVARLAGTAVSRPGTSEPETRAGGSKLDTSYSFSPRG